MMDYKVNDIIKFKDGEYLVLNVIKNQENTYLYLINNDEYKNDISITRVVEENNEIRYLHIEENEEFEYVMNKIFMDCKDDILELLNLE
jgi:hypothetical protein